MDRWNKIQNYRKFFTQDQKGNFQYTGQWYLPENSQHKCQRLLMLKILFNGIILILMGFLPADPMVRGKVGEVNYLLMIYSVLFLLSIVNLYFGFQALTDRMKFPEYHFRLPEKILGICLLKLIVIGILLILFVFYLICFSKIENFFWNGIWLGMIGILFIVNMYFFQSWKKIRWKIQENEYVTKDGG